MASALELLAPGFEEIEAITIIDLLRRASIKVMVAGLVKESVQGSHDIIIKPDAFYKQVKHNEYDILILPGGQPGTNNLKEDNTVLDWVRQRHNSNQLIAAICAAPKVLEAAGITSGFKLTSFPSEKAVFDPQYYSEKNVVIDRHIITSRGVGTAIDFTLAIISVLKNPECAEDLRKRILYVSNQ